MSEATARPWKMQQNKSHCGFSIWGESGCLAEGWYEVGRSEADNAKVKANAELIVRAVNSFDDLLAALKKCSEWNSLHENFSTELDRMVEEAIAKAEEGK